jgi:hypothetical protein
MAGLFGSATRIRGRFREAHLQPLGYDQLDNLNADWVRVRSRTGWPATIWRRLGASLAPARRDLTHRTGLSATCPERILTRDAGGSLAWSVPLAGAPTLRTAGRACAFEPAADVKYRTSSHIPTAIQWRTLPARRAVCINGSSAAKSSVPQAPIPSVRDGVAMLSLWLGSLLLTPTPPTEQATASHH